MDTVIKILLAADILSGLFFRFSSGFKGKRFYWIKKEISGLILLAGGIVGFYAVYTENSVLLRIAFWSCVGLFSISLGVFDLIKIRICKTMVYGRFVESKISGTGRNRSVTPTFEYTYGGVVYKNESGENIPPEISKNYEAGKPYPVFICENEPYLYITDRNMIGKAIFEILLGIIVISAAFL